MELERGWGVAYLLLGVFSEKPSVTGHPLVMDVSCGTCTASSLQSPQHWSFQLDLRSLVDSLCFSFLAPAFTKWRAFHEAEWALGK